MAMGHGLNVVAIVRSDVTGAALSESLTNMNGTRIDVHVGELHDVHPDVDIFADVDVLLLDVDPGNSNEIATLDSIVSDRFPKTPVIATTANASLQDVRQLMRMGVVDVVPQPMVPSDLGAAIEFAARSKSKADGGEERQGKVISLWKAGGGVGATTLAVQAGHLFSQRLKGSGTKACVLDFDLQFGNASLYMDVDNRVGLLDLVESPDRLDVSLLQSVMGHHESGLDVLASPRNVTGRPPRRCPAPRSRGTHARETAEPLRG